MPASRHNRPNVTIGRPGAPESKRDAEQAAEKVTSGRLEDKPNVTMTDEPHGEALTDQERAELKAHVATLPRTPETTNDVHPAETAQSATVNLARCEVKSGKEGDKRRRQCQLNAGHDQGENPTDHKFRTAGQAEVSKPLSQLVEKADDLDAMFEDVPETEVVQVKETSRDDFQKKFDAIVAASYEAWVEKGRPGNFNDSPRKRWVGNPEAAPAVRKALLRAGNLLEKRVRIAPNKTHESGKTMIYFVATDRQGKAGKPATEPTAETTEKALADARALLQAGSLLEKRTDTAATEPAPDSE